MLNLTKDYNRAYYKRRVKIWLKLKFGLTRLFICGKLMKLAYRIDKKSFTKIVKALNETGDYYHEESGTR